jgi:hypothetical protein
MHVSKAFPDFEVCISFEVFGRDMVKLASDTAAAQLSDRAKELRKFATFYNMSVAGGWLNQYSL